MRAALANMWDAELHLRMGRPEKALPYEYRALKLIKQIQQASRIYVERVGFDPPVIKVAEKRLSGDLNDINNPSIKKNTAASENLPAIRKAVSLLENLNAENGDLSVEAKMKLQKAGDELAAFAAEQGGTLLTDLQKLRALIDGEVTEAKRRTYIGDLQKTFWQLLSVETLPQRSQSPSRSRLNNLFLDEIGKL